MTNARGSASQEAKIVPVTPDMTDRLVALVRSFHGESGYAVDPLQADAVAALCADSGLGRAWLLIIGGKDSGYALTYRRHSIDHGGAVAVLDDLWIDASERGRGLGSLLLSTVCDALLEKGLRAVLLNADPADARAQAFYARAGFKPTGTATLERQLTP